MSGPLNLLINMDGAHERLAHFQAQAAAAGLDFERVAAVNGRAMSEADLERHRDRAAIYPLSGAEIGCALSHRRAWEKIVEANVAWGCVFEDDACLVPDAGSVISAWPHDRDVPIIVKLEATNGHPVALEKKEMLFAGRSLRALRGLSIGTAGYAINRSACLALLQMPARYAVPLDLYLFSKRHGAVRGITTFHLDPAPVIQADRLETLAADTALASTIRERGKRLRPRPPVTKLVRREFYRLREQVLEIGAHRKIIDWA